MADFEQQVGAKVLGVSWLKVVLLGPIFDSLGDGFEDEAMRSVGSVPSGSAAHRARCATGANGAVAVRRHAQFS